MWGGQLYNHKWLSTTYSLQLLRQFGLDPDNPQAQKGCRALLDGGFVSSGGIRFAKSAAEIDNGVTGMILSLLAYFNYPDSRVASIAEYLLGQQQPDGRWEPVTGNKRLKYTFDTTLLVLEGLREHEKMNSGQDDRVKAAQRKGREFLLQHSLYKNGSVGEALDKTITLFSFPPRWHYDLLAVLDYFQECKAPQDPRLEDGMRIILAKRNPAGDWNLQNRHPGKTFFELEEAGKPSRWNTLRAQRVLKWRRQSQLNNSQY